MFRIVKYILRAILEFLNVTNVLMGNIWIILMLVQIVLYKENKGIFKIV